VPITCLVVEDEPDIVAVIGLSLPPPRYALLVADSIAAARRLLATAPSPDVVVLDWVLPDGDADALCRELKARRPAPPVVVLTARGAAREAALAAGADVFILKPFDPDALQATVDRLVASGRP
jgi:DNA-binding response OmpR family regulator